MRGAFTRAVKLQTSSPSASMQIAPSPASPTRRNLVGSRVRAA